MSSSSLPSLTLLSLLPLLGHDHNLNYSLHQDMSLLVELYVNEISRISSLGRSVEICCPSRASMQLGYCYSFLNSRTILSDSCAFEGIHKYVSLKVAHNAAQVSLIIFDIVARPIPNPIASWLS